MERHKSLNVYCSPLSQSDKPCECYHCRNVKRMMNEASSLHFQLSVEESEDGKGLVYYFGILSAAVEHSGIVTAWATNTEGEDFVKTSLKVIGPLQILKLLLLRL